MLEEFRKSITGPLMLIVFATGLSGFQVGYDAGWWTVMVALPQFSSRFGSDVLVPGLPYRAISVVQLAISNSFPYVFQLLGGAAGGTVADRFGRIMPMYCAAVMYIIATVIQMTSSINGYRFWQIVAGKFIVASASGMMLVSVPLYISELAPKSVRGVLVGAVAWSVTLGSLISAVIMNVAFQKTGPIVWLLPMGLQLPLPLLVLSLGFLLPESPRWLLANGRRDQALKSLRKIRTKSTQQETEMEVATIQDSLDREAEMTKGTWSDCFKGRNLFRTHIVTAVASFGPSQGFSFITSYLVLFLVQLGIKNPLLLNIYINVVVCVAVLFSAGVLDLVGRRRTMITCAILMAIGMLTLAGITTESPKPTGSLANACVFSLFLWVVGYCIGWTTGPVVVGTEVPNQRVRDKTYGLSVMCASAVQALTAGVSAPLQKSLGGKIGFVYGSFSVITVIWCFFFLPELRGRNMDEIDVLFERRVDIRKMRTTVIDLDQTQSRSLNDIEELAEPIVDPSKKHTGSIEHIEKW